MGGAIPAFQVDVFTARPFAGNPAAVVLEAGGLPEATMRAIAAEMGRPATAFVGGVAGAEGALGLRCFGPSGVELAFCGHGTIAAVHVLAETGRLRGDRVVFDTAAGRLPAAVAERSEGRLIWLEPTLRACTPYRQPPAPILDALGMAAGAVGAWGPVAVTTEQDLLIPATGLDVLKSLAPDLERLGGLGRERALRGFCVTSRETVEPGSVAHSRFFAPHYGIPEDFATGSLHAALAVWLWEAGLLAADGDPVAFRAEQGDVLGRPGRIAVELRVDAGRPAGVRVGGQAVTVLTGRLRVT